MPNNVTNKIIFDKKHLDEISKDLLNEGFFDFNNLVKMPINVYRGNLSPDDEKDFPLNWLSWCRENWGTKWNSYSCKNGIEDNLAYICFDTAWSVPYPVIVAFAKKYNIDFELKYFDEGHNFWGIEKWSGGGRKNKQYSDEADKVSLCVELKGYNPEDE